MTKQFYIPDPYIIPTKDQQADADKVMPQWISVKDRLPEIDQWCSWWDFSGATEPCTAFRSVDDIETWWENYTHWMPLPKPPVEQLECMEKE